MHIEQRELLQTIVFETVQLECPHQLGFLEGLWYAWSNQIDTCTENIDSLNGFHAVGDTEDESIITIFLILLVAFISSLPSTSHVPSQEDLDDALRAFGHKLGYQGKPLEQAVTLGTSRFIRIMNRLTGPNGSQPPQQPSKLYWMTTYQDGVMSDPIRLGKLKPKPDQYPQGLDLIVDEPRGICIGTHKEHPILEMSEGKKMGLWLALHFSGDSFTIKDIQDRTPGKIDDQSCRKHPMNGNKACIELIGRSVIPHGKNKQYTIPPRTWSWAWILDSAIHEHSQLLHESVRNSV